MASPLRVLHIEDTEDDARLVALELERGGWEPACTRVDTAAAMRAALERESWDLVISDYGLPRFDAPSALSVLQEFGLDVPFIIVSGTISEDGAVAAMKAGAHDYVLKGNLKRLAPAVRRELREAASRRERRDAETKRRAAEVQLLESDRMATIGTIAAGVAHEINNPLAALLHNLELARGAAGEVTGAATAITALRTELVDAQAAALRVAQIVGDLRIFSRGTEEKRQPVDTRRVLESSLRLVWNEIRHRAELVRDYQDVPNVLANEARLGQVFLNLLANAAQAIPAGNAKANKITVRTSSDGARVLVDVADTGGGLSEAARAHLFEPFFTTKPAGVGTGLGLSICRRIITELGGTIWAEPAEPRGTVFRIALPIAEGVEPPPPPAPPPPQRAATRRGRVLVVDDEDLLRRTVVRSLGVHHDVTGAASGREALALLAAGPPFDVILCDLMMPEMTGPELHAELARTAPALAADMVFLTGGAFTEEARAFLDEVPNVRFEKPFSPEELLALIAKRLAG